MKMKKEMNIGNSVLFAFVLRFALLFVALVRVGKPFFMAIAIVVTLLLYFNFRKRKRRPIYFIATMAITHCIFAAFIEIACLVMKSRIVPPNFELVLAGYVAVILLCDLIIIKIIKSRKPSE